VRECGVNEGKEGGWRQARRRMNKERERADPGIFELLFEVGSAGLQQEREGRGGRKGRVGARRIKGEVRKQTSVKQRGYMVAAAYGRVEGGGGGAEKHCWGRRHM